MFGAGCGDDDGEPADPDGGGSDTDGAVTYTEDIAPLLESHCTTCHSAGLTGADRNGAPVGVDFDSYAAASAGASAANGRIQSGSMPPAGPLSGANQALFQSWIDQGTPQ